MYRWFFGEHNISLIRTLKAYLSEEILNCHSLSLSLNADLCIHFYWLSRLRQASYRKKIQSSALTLRLWLCHFKISSDTPTLSWLLLRKLMNPLISDCQRPALPFIRKYHTQLYNIHTPNMKAVCTLQMYTVEVHGKCSVYTANKYCWITAEVQ